LIQSGSTDLSEALPEFLKNSVLDLLSMIKTVKNLDTSTWEVLLGLFPRKAKLEKIL
jgi:hypothetical protein